MIRLADALAHKEHILWDWNGTLLDDVDLCVEVIGSLLARHALPSLTREDYRNRFGFPVRSYYESLGFDFSRVPFERLSAEFIEAYNARVDACGLYSGAGELLERLATLGKRQAILSAAHEEDLKRIARRHGVSAWVPHLYGLSDHYAAGKVSRGRELLAALGARPETCVLVGDTLHDAEVARELGIDAVLLGDGHQAPHRLETTGCTVITCRKAMTIRAGGESLRRG